LFDFLKGMNEFSELARTGAASKKDEKDKDSARAEAKKAQRELVNKVCENICVEIETLESMSMGDDPSNRSTYSLDTILDVIGRCEGDQRSNKATEVLGHATWFGRLVTMVLCHAELEFLYAYYSKKQILKLPISNMLTLAKMCQTKPSGMCFYAEYAKHLTVEGKLVSNMKELSEETHDQICKKLKIECSQLERDAISLYKKIKTLYVTSGHQCLPLHTLKVYSGISTDERFYEGMCYLVENGTVVCTNNPKSLNSPGYACPASADETIPNVIVYLTIAYAAERMIVQGMNKVFEGYREEPPKNKKDVSPSMILRPRGWTEEDRRGQKPKEKSCSEQIQTRSAGRDKEASPVLMIVGPGGSGKTSVLWHLNDNIVQGKVAVTPQCATAAGLNRRGITASTVHSLLSMHSKLCPKSPYYNERSYWKCKLHKGAPKFRDAEHKKTFFAQHTPKEKLELKYCMEALGVRFRPQAHKGRCFLYEVMTLIAEEISLMDTCIFAALMGVLLECGNVCRVIMCGDHNQLPQITFGRLAKDFVEGFSSAVLEFNHSHRFSESGLIYCNAKRIQEKKFDQVDFSYPEHFRLIPAHIRTDDRKDERKLYAFLRKTFVENNIRVKKDNMILTRTNYIKDIASRVLRMLTFGNMHFNKGQKVFVMGNCGRLISKQIYVIAGVEYVELEEGHRANILSRDDACIIGGKVLGIRDSTEPWTRMPRTDRDVICRLLVYPTSCSSEPKPDDLVRMPAFGSFLSDIRDASVITSNSAQGLEANECVTIKLYFWNEGDTTEELFVCSTRGRKSMTLISTESIIKQSTENPQPMRLSVMSHYLKEICADHVWYLKEKHQKNREKYQAKRQGKSMRGDTDDSFFAKENPTDNELMIRPCAKAEKLKKIEVAARLYDAEAMMEDMRKKQEEERMERYMQEAKRLLAAKEEEDARILKLKEEKMKRKLARAQAREEKRKRSEKTTMDSPVILSPPTKRLRSE
jgi:hypothetical protein